jgi:hypothetical protein
MEEHTEKGGAADGSMDPAAELSKEAAGLTTEDPQQQQ